MEDIFGFPEESAHIPAMRFPTKSSWKIRWCQMLLIIYMTVISLRIIYMVWVATNSAKLLYSALHGWLWIKWFIGKLSFMKNRQK